MTTSNDIAGITPSTDNSNCERPSRDDLIAALKFYANREHLIWSDQSAWDTVSGEPQNWWCDEAGTATVEDGTIAAKTLAGELTARDIEELEDGEDVGITPAQANDATTKCYSLDDETFSRDSLGDLLDDMAEDELGLQVGRVYYAADSQELTPNYMADAGAVASLLEQLDEDLFDDVGETADNDFTAASPEAREELRVLLRGWIEKHINIGRYWRIVGETRECRLTAEDIADHLGITPAGGEAAR